MNAKLLSWSVMMLGQAIAFADPPSATCDPSDPDGRRAIVSATDREQLGVRQKDWPGKVNPEVYRKLDALTKRIAELKAILHEKEGRDEDAWGAMEATQFEGTVCVQVLLRPDQDIGDVERQVLRTLKGSEFYSVYLFRAVPAFVGYATKEALGKLAANPDVAGVCLDDEPFPRSETLTKDMFPDPQPNERNEPGVREGKVQPEVYRALSKNERVDVIVSLRANLLPTETAEPMWPGEQKRRVSFRLQNRVLDGVNADDFWLHSRMESVPMIFGQITREGVQKLCANPDVERISMSGRKHLSSIRG